MIKENEYEINITAKWFSDSEKGVRADLLDEIDNPDSILFQTTSYTIKEVSQKEPSGDKDLVEYLENNTEYNGNSAHNEVVDYMHTEESTKPPTGTEAVTIALNFILDSIWDAKNELQHVIRHLSPLPLDTSELTAVLAEANELVKQAESLAERLRDNVENDNL